MTRRILCVIIGVVVTQVLGAMGGAEESRESTMDMVASGSFVAASYIDLESVLDEYGTPYGAEPGASLSFFLDVEKPLVPEWGDTNLLQVSLLTGGVDLFPEIDLNYVVFPYSPGLFDDPDLRDGLKRGLNSLLESKVPGQNVYLFLRVDKELVRISSTVQIDDVLDRAQQQLQSPGIREAAARLAEAERDLRLALEAGAQIPGDNPTKFFWVLGKPIADSSRDFRDVSATIAGYGDTDTEISFCGHGEEFRSQSVSVFVSQFGGNSYFITDGADMEKTIQDDFDFYRRPAITDLEITVHTVGAAPNREPIRTYTQRSMGPDEHHIVLTEFYVPPLSEYLSDVLSLRGGYSSDADKRALMALSDYPLAYLTISYRDERTAARVYDDRVVMVDYTDDYSDSMEAMSPAVTANLAILDTYRLFGTVAQFLSYGNYADSLIQINSHIGRLEQLNKEANDALITEDIQMLRDYKQVILENRDNPLRGLKAINELWGRRY